MKNFFKTLPLRARMAMSTNSHKADTAILWMSRKGDRLKDFKEVLPLVTNEQSRSYIARSWLDKEGRTSEDLKEVLPLITNEHHRLNIAQSWLDKEGRTVNDLAAALSLFENTADKSTLTESWVGKAGRTLEDLTAVLSLFDNLEDKSAIARSWLEKDGRTLEDLTEVLSLFDDAADKSAIAASWVGEERSTLEDLTAALSLFEDAIEYKPFLAASWVATEGRTLDDLAAALSLFDDATDKSVVAESWVRKKGRTLDDLAAALSLFDDAKDKSAIATSWVNQEARTLEELKVVLPLVTCAPHKSTIADLWVHGEGSTSEDLIATVSLFDDAADKSAIAASWVDKAGRTLKDLTAVLSLFDNLEDKSAIARSWLEKDGRTLEDLTEVLSLFDDAADKSAIAESWVRKKGRTLDDLAAALSLFDDAKDKSAIATSWVNQEARTLEELKVVLPLVTCAPHKSKIAYLWVHGEGSTSEDLIATVSLFDDAKDKSAIAKSWVNEKAKTLEDLKVALPLVTYAPHKSFVAKYLMGRASKEESTFEYLTAVLSLFDDANDKSAIATSWLSQDHNQATKYENFTTLAKEGILSNSDRYDVREIAHVYLGLSLPINKFPDLCTDLYPNSEILQTELFKSFIDIIPADDLSEIKTQLKSFIQNLHEDDSALEAITAVVNKLDLPPLEILEISKNRLSNKYESVSDLLKGKTLEESLSEEELRSVRGLFSNNTSPIDINLADLFSYYDFKKELTEFKSLLLPEVLREIAQNFSPSSKSAYVSEAEFRKMSDLFNSSATPESNLRLPSVKIVADYLSSKLGDISRDLTPEEIDNYQFGNSKILPTQSREDLTKQFRNLLTKENSTEEVSAFFEAALNITNNDANNEKMCNFFNGNKSLLALLFQQEDGLDNYSGTIATLTDGCGANIATQSKIALYQALITDPCDQVLFSAFKTKISGAVLNSGGDLLTGSTQGINVFQDHNINKNFISPNGLLTALSEEFCYKGKIIKNALEFVKNEVGENARDDLTDSVLEKDPNTFNQEMAKISAYITLQKTLPDLCENKYLSKPRAEYLEIVQEGLKQKLAESSNSGIALAEIHLEDHPDSSVIPSVSSQVVHDISMAVQQP